jgi:hypothetical protein
MQADRSAWVVPAALDGTFLRASLDFPIAVFFLLPKVPCLPRRTAGRISRRTPAVPP